MLITLLSIFAAHTNKQGEMIRDVMFYAALMILFSPQISQD